MRIKENQSKLFLVLGSLCLFLTACITQGQVENIETNSTKLADSTQVSSVLLTSTPTSFFVPTTNTPVPTETAVPLPTKIPLPLPQMTPFPTVTPDYDAQELKNIFLYYGDIGGDGGIPLGKYNPLLVIYTDGQTLIRSGDRMTRTYFETYLSPDEMCQLQNNIEKTGFLEPHDPFGYYTQLEGSVGASNVVIQVEETFYSFYSRDVQYLQEDLHAGYRVIADYQPSTSLVSYIPNQIALWIDKFQPEEAPTILNWPEDFPSIETLQPNPDGGIAMIEGELVGAVYNLLSGQLSSKFVMDGDEVYRILPYFLLPHESLQNFSNYPDPPLDYISYVHCAENPVFISPAIPTATPTLTSLASRLTGNGYLLFVTDADGDEEIYVMEADGTSRLRLTNNQFDDWSPSWSPDGEFIVFVSDRDGDSELYIMAADGTDVIQITHNEVDDYSPEWSPNGSEIVFVSDRHDGWQQSEIYLISVDSLQESRVTNNTMRDLRPTWSLDGNQIFFVQEVEFNELYQFAYTNSDQIGFFDQETLFPVGRGGWPILSPDGMQIATAKELENRESVIEFRTSSDLEFIKSFQIEIFLPSLLDWSIDGNFLIFSGYSLAGNRDIFALDVNSGELIQLTFSQHDEFSPSIWP